MKMCDTQYELINLCFVSKHVIIVSSRNCTDVVLKPTKNKVKTLKWIHLLEILKKLEC